MRAEKVLIVESDPNILELAAIKLSKAGYLVLTATGSAEFLNKAAKNPPDVIVVNPNLADGGGYKACAELASLTGFKEIPLLLLVDGRSAEEIQKAAAIKAAGRLTKPFNPRSLLNQVNAVVDQARFIRKMNPVTELPGLLHIEEKMTAILREGRRFNLVFTDLQGFKHYNKQYGYDQGNRVIQFTAQLLREEATQSGCEAEIFHFGADKFGILCGAAPVDAMADQIIARFAREIPNRYGEEDRLQGGLAITNRQGTVEHWPFMAVVLAIVNNENRIFGNWLEIEAVGAELLKFAKTMSGNRVVRDRRCS